LKFRRSACTCRNFHSVCCRGPRTRKTLAESVFYGYAEKVGRDMNRPRAQGTGGGVFGHFDASLAHKQNAGGGRASRRLRSTTHAYWSSYQRLRYDSRPRYRRLIDSIVNFLIGTAVIKFFTNVSKKKLRTALRYLLTCTFSFFTRTAVYTPTYKYIILLRSTNIHGIPKLCIHNTYTVIHNILLQAV